MTTIDIKFEWTRGHAYECGPEVIRQTGRGRDRFRPLEIPAKLYLAFAELDGTPDACVGFARSWGLLTTQARDGALERLDGWQREIKQMKSRISMVAMVRTANSRRVRMRMTSLDVALVSGEPNTRPALVLQPRTLLDAMHLQLAQSHASGAALQTCTQCGKWFEVGGDAKRSMARFCSDSCRNRFHYQKKHGGKS
jgi:hypothetical protein